MFVGQMIFDQKKQNLFSMGAAIYTGLLSLKVI